MLMAKLIRLHAGQRKVSNINHPLLKKVKKNVTEEMVQEIASSLPDSKDELVDALRGCVSRNVGGFVAHYKCKNHVDDMVSEAFCALIRFVDEISLDESKRHDILKIASRRIRQAVETYLNSFQSLFYAGLTLQKKKAKNGEEPVYGLMVDMSEEHEPAADDDICKRDVLEALESLEVENKLDAYILCPDYWGWSDTALAKKLGVDIWKVNRRRRRLYNKYLELTR
jgi:hypothetical protein